MEDKMDISITVETIIDWLSTKHTTLWSDWSIDDDKGRAKAAEWFYREIDGLIRFMVSQEAQSSYDQALEMVGHRDTSI